jgi:acyl carrier protein
VLDVKIKIVNPDSKIECPEFRVGEIWAKSNSNAKGYWNHQELSEHTFNAFTADTQDGPYLRTGDMGFIADGELFITGRLKDLIIIRGNNHYPQDIELTAERSNALLRPGRIAAFSIDADNEERLVIVQEARSKQNVDWLRVCKDIKDAVLAEHNISPYKIVLIKSKSIYLTSSGKIQRKATKESFINNSLDIIFEWTDNEKVDLEFVEESEIKDQHIKMDKDTISKIIAEQLAGELKISSKEIDKNMAFTDFGLDSAKNLILVGKLEKVVDRTLESTILWNYPTINKLAEYLAAEFSDISSDSDKAEDLIDNDFAQKVDELSEEEAAELLLKKLNEND